MAIQSFSIKQKIIFSITFSVFVTAITVASIGQWAAKSIIEERMLNSELPNKLNYIRSEIDKDITQMKSIAQQIATSKFILDWNQNGQSAKGEQMLVDQLSTIARQFNLSAASFSDKQTARYWNQDGFLRVLQRDNADSWFYDYIATSQADMVSMYVYPDGTNVDLFVNYQQLEGRGLGGVAKSFNHMANQLKSYKLEQSGFVFLVDQKGEIQLHKNKQLTNKTDLNRMFSNPSLSNGLLTKNEFNMLEIDINGEPTILAASYIPSMKWYVVAQVPTHEVFSSLNNAELQIMLWALLVAGVSIFVAMLVASSISKPIESLADVFTGLGQSGGDLTHRLPVKGETELDKLAQGYNTFASKIAAVLKSVANTGQVVEQASQLLENESNALLVKSQHVESNTVQVVTAVSQIHTTIEEVAVNAVGAAESAANAQDKAMTNKDTMTLSSHSIEQLSTQIKNTSRVVKGLVDNTKSIGSVLEVIRAVSEQTNLLALNAAIEAARAGEHGRGFAVVAEEVRNLAQRTADSTSEIDNIITRLVDATDQTEDEMNQSIGHSNTGMGAISTVLSSLEEIIADIIQINDMNTMVATATEEQSVAIKDVDNNMSNINGLIQDNLSASKRIVDASTSLNTQSHQLMELINQFKYEENGRDTIVEKTSTSDYGNLRPAAAVS